MYQAKTLFKHFVSGFLKHVMMQCVDVLCTYSGSKLTWLMRDALGGNCKTRAIFCFKPSSDPTTLSAILHFSGQLSHVQNYPIVNDSFARVSHVLDGEVL